ncbi:MAG: XdhC family protein [Dehalococcoidia bacterium]
MAGAADRVAIMEAVESALAGGMRVVVATVVDAGSSGLTPGAKLSLAADESALGTFGSEPLDEAVRAQAREMLTTVPRVTMQTLYVSPDGELAERRSQAGAGDAEVMLQLFESPSRLVVVGGGHVGHALATIGEIVGFAVTVIDDREEFANRDRFPMAEHVICAEVEDALDAVELDANTYVVLVSRGHRVDEEALRHSVGRGAAYVGMIGSRRRTGTVLRHLLEEGFSREALEAVSTPIGLDIGAETPEEIAVSILAEIVMVQRGGSGERMRAGRRPILGAVGGVGSGAGEGSAEPSESFDERP